MCLQQKKWKKPSIPHKQQFKKRYNQIWAYAFPPNNNSTPYVATVDRTLAVCVTLWESIHFHSS